MTGSVLAINGGSSSLKFVLYAPAEPPRRLLAGEVERIGLNDPFLRAGNADARSLNRKPVEAPNHEAAADRVIEWLSRQVGQEAVCAIAHRIVHGGPKYSQSQIITPELMAELKRLSPLDPTHLPKEIALIEAFGRSFPDLPQVACFDTAFHHDLPRVARLLPVPRKYEAWGVRRYGFHGLSYAFLMDELRRCAGEDAANGRVILAHLGAGASMAAVRAGRCIDTTMAFTPAAGLVMGTRCGDLDPGLLVHFMRNEHMTADQIDDLINHRSGLIGISEISSDLRDLMARESSDARAAEAVAIFCYSARKWIGALAAALGGLDALVFSAGIGENAPEVRARICAGLEFLGIQLDPTRNAANAAVISADGAAVAVRVIRTDEESIMVRDVLRVLGSG